MAAERPHKQIQDIPKMDNAEVEPEDDDDEELEEEPQIVQHVNRFNVKTKRVGNIESSIGTLYRSGPVWQGLLIIPTVAVIYINIGGIRINRKTDKFVVWQGRNYNADVVSAHLHAHRVE